MKRWERLVVHLRLDHAMKIATRGLDRHLQVLEHLLNLRP